MNIEEAIKVLNNFNTVDCGREDTQAIETLLTAYEKEKGENVKLRLQDIPLIEGELKAYKDRVNELKAELEKEKEKNKELSNSYDKLAKECNEENRRCMLLAVENQDLKEKNKSLEQEKEYLNCIIESDKDNYINKDKIKAKIEEFKIVRDTILKNEKEFNRPMMTYDLKRNDYCEKMLQSLLEKE